MNKKFIRGRLRLNFKTYSNKDYDKLVRAKGWNEIERLCSSYFAEGSLFDTTDNKVYFDYKIVRPKMKECKRFVKKLKAKLRNTYKVRVNEALAMSGDSWQGG